MYPINCFCTNKTQARFWKNYAEQELKAQNKTNVEQIFGRCLLQCLNVELWTFYLDYLRKHKSPEDLGRAYELSRNTVGLDISSSSIWIDSITFMKDLKTADQNQKTQQIQLLRQIYQEALQIPMHNLDKIWKDYESFENEVNPAMAKNFLGEMAPKQKSAMNKYKERKNIRENMGGVGGLLLNMLATPPTGSEKERVQKQIWKDLIELEKRNTQRLSTQEVKRRVMFTYQQCLLCFRHHVDIWYEGAMYLSSLGYNEEASAFFQSGCTALLPPKKTDVVTPKEEGSILLHLAYAEYLETKKKFEEADKIFEDLLKVRDEPLVYIQYLRYTRRTKGIDAAREIFIRAKKAANCTYHVWVASAMLEHLSNDQTKVATGVFKLGLNQPFGKEPGFILQYLSFLEQLNDKNNTRVLFETILNEMPKEKSVEIWNKFLQFEYSLYDLNSIEKVEERKEQAFPQGHDLLGVSTTVHPVVDSSVPKTADPTSGLVNLINRIKFLDLWPCNTKEMELLNLKAQESEILPAEDESHRRYGKAFYRVDYTKQITFTNTRQQSHIEKSSAPAAQTFSLPQNLNKYRECLTQKRIFLPDFRQMNEYKVVPSNPSASYSTTYVNIVDEYQMPSAVLNVLRKMPVHNLPIPNSEYVLESLNKPLPLRPLDDKRGRDEYEDVQEDEEIDEENIGAAGSYEDIYTKRRRQRK